MAGKRKPTSPHVLAAIEAAQAKFKALERRPADHVVSAMGWALQPKTEVQPPAGRAAHVEAAIKQAALCPQPAPAPVQRTPDSSPRANGLVLQRMESNESVMAPERKEFVKKLLRRRMKDIAWAGEKKGFIDRPYAEELTYGIRDMGTFRKMWQQQMDTADQLFLIDPSLAGRKLSFEDWFREKSEDRSLGPIKKVQYLGAQDRQDYQVTVRGGKCYRANALFDTSGLKTDHMGRGWAIFVLSPTGQIYSGSHIAEEFHHSSFLAGGRVASAGEWKVEKGVIKAINDKSGHYKPSDPMNFLMLAHLTRGGVQLGKVRASFRSYAGYGEIRASDVFEDRGRGPRPERKYEVVKDCFLTTACVSALGLSDDCVELMTLREFRDGYLEQFPEGRALISEYYKIAPELVRAIDSEAVAPYIYLAIYQLVLECVFDIRADDNARAVVRYTCMVNGLSHLFDRRRLGHLGHKPGDAGAVDVLHVLAGSARVALGSW